MVAKKASVSKTTHRLEQIPTKSKERRKWYWVLSEFDLSWLMAEYSAKNNS